MKERYERYHPDLATLHRNFREKPCFVCEVVADTNDMPQNIVYEDESFIAFLDSYPRAYGYTLVSPKEHRERVTADFDRGEYLELQDLIYRVTEAVRLEVGAERCMYSPSAVTRASRTFTGTWSRCRPEFLMGISRETGRRGARASWTFHKRTGPRSQKR